MRNRPIRAAAVALGLAVLGASALVPTSAQAVAAGTVALTPTTGNVDSLITLSTSGPCSSSAVNVQAVVSGFGFSDPVVVRTPSSTGFSSSNPMNLALENTFLVYAQDYGTPLVGPYQLAVQCVDALGSVVLNEFTTTMNWTTPGNSLANVDQATYTSSLPAASTTTTLATSLTSPRTYGTALTLSATVDAGDTDPTTGSVEFRDGATLLGTVALSGTNTAQKTGVVLNAGSHSLTAKYVGVSGFGASTSSATSFTINPAAFVRTKAPALVGQAKVGVRIVGNWGAWSPSPTSVKYQWLRDGAPISGATNYAYVPSTADAGKRISMRFTLTRASYTTVVQTTPQATVALGTFSRSKTAAVIGTTRAGYTVSAYNGAWSPTPSSYRYQWYRNGVAISRATGSKYKISTADRGKRLQVKVTALRTGFTPGVSWSPSRTVS
jgi:hypothetical protein